jgi:hypothetical protein
MKGFALIREQKNILKCIKIFTCYCLMFVQGHYCTYTVIVKDGYYINFYTIIDMSFHNQCNVFLVWSLTFHVAYLQKLPSISSSM